MRENPGKGMPKDNFELVKVGKIVSVSSLSGMANKKTAIALTNEMQFGQILGKKKQLKLW